METKILKEPSSRPDIAALAHEQYGDIVKAVVDIEQGLMGVGGELHVDIQSLLIEAEGSRGDKTWGINLYPGKTGDDFIEFDSMINLKPLIGNRTRGVDDPAVQRQIRDIVGKLVP